MGESTRILAAMVRCSRCAESMGYGHLFLLVQGLREALGIIVDDDVTVGWGSGSRSH